MGSRERVRGREPLSFYAQHDRDQGLVTLAADRGELPCLVKAQFATGRAMMLLNAAGVLPDGTAADMIHGLSPSAAFARFGHESDATPGNASFSFGASIIAPFTGRIAGIPISDPGEIETIVAGRPIRLRANGGDGCAIHGLILKKACSAVAVRADAKAAWAFAVIEAGDFDGRWPSRARLEITWRMSARSLSVRVVTVNVGCEPLPIGIGWHPYIAIPRAQRSDARLRVAASARLPVRDYQSMIPTGEVLTVAGTSFDMLALGGVRLGERSFDDCFVDLGRDKSAEVWAEVIDPAARLSVRVSSRTPQVRALQIYAPANNSFVAIEPNFAWPDPYGTQWGGRETGMVLLPPGHRIAYDAAITIFDTIGSVSSPEPGAPSS